MVLFLKNCLALVLSVTPIYPVLDKGVKTRKLKINVMIFQGEFNGKQIIVFTPNKTIKTKLIQLMCRSCMHTNLEMQSLIAGKFSDILFYNSVI